MTKHVYLTTGFTTSLLTQYVCMCMCVCPPILAYFTGFHANECETPISSIALHQNVTGSLCH